MAAVYGAAITYLPWETWRGSEFADIINYINRIERISFAGLEGFAGQTNVLSLISGEYLWALLLMAVTDYGVDEEVFLRTITFFCSSVAFFFSARYIGGALAFVLLINPLSIDLYTSQIRSAFAFSLLLIGYSGLSRGIYIKFVGAICILAAPFIHTASSLLILFGLVSVFLARLPEVWPRAKNYISLGIALVVAFGFTALGNQVLSTIGDRRTLSAEDVRSVSFLLFWILCTGVFVCQKAALFSRGSISQYSIAILGFSITSEFMGSPAFRIISVSLPLIFACLALLPKQHRYLMAASMSCYNILQFSYWLRG